VSRSQVPMFDAREGGHRYGVPSGAEHPQVVDRVENHGRQHHEEREPDPQAPETRSPRALRRPKPRQRETSDVAGAIRKVRKDRRDEERERLFVVL
jgi:hypothetical protein